MSKPPPATFAGYVSEAGGRLMQDWFDSLPVEEKGEIQDIFNHLATIPVTEWKRPAVDRVRTPLVEIRCKAGQANHEIRIYGVFDVAIRARYILLNGNECKKKDHDKDGQDLALKRLGLINQGKASTHEFAFEERAYRPHQAKSEKPLDFVLIEFKQRYRVPDSGDQK